MVKGLHHVCMVVKSFKESLPLYEKLLNVKASVSAPLPSGMRLATLELPGGGSVELMEPTAPGSSAAQTLEKHGECVDHICLEVDDVDAELARAEQAGAYVADKKSRTGPGYAIAFFRTAPESPFRIELFAKKK